jgi:hypothetical protein
MQIVIFDVIRKTVTVKNIGGGGPNGQIKLRPL